MELNEDVIQIVWKPDNFRVGNIKIVKKSTKKFNEAANFYKKITIQANNYSREQKRNKNFIKWNAKNNFNISSVLHMIADKII